MAGGLQFLSSRFILLLFISYSLGSPLKFPNQQLSNGSLFLSLNLGSRVFPGRNCGLRRVVHGSGLPPYLKAKAGLFVAEIGLSTLMLVLLSGDICVNPGPPTMLYPAGNETCSSDDESTLTDSSSSLISCAEELDDSFTHEADNQDTQCYFDLGLGNRGLRIGSWNVEGLTLSKFDQIGLFMLSSDNRPQIDILSINESHLKPSTPDSLFDVPGFDMHRRDRKGGPALRTRFRL